MTTSASDDARDTMTETDRRPDPVEPDRGTARGPDRAEDDTTAGTPATMDARSHGAGAENERSPHDTSTSTTDEAADRADQASPDNRTAPEGARADGEGQPPLVGQVERFRTRWESVQIGFVDDPREAVRQADELVTQVLDDLLSSFQQQRGELEELWSRGDDASTDELRRAFQRHRMLFDRLLSA